MSLPRLSSDFVSFCFPSSFPSLSAVSFFLRRGPDPVSLGISPRLQQGPQVRSITLLGPSFMPGPPYDPMFLSFFPSSPRSMLLPTFRTQIALRRLEIHQLLEFLSVPSSCPPNARSFLHFRILFLFQIPLFWAVGFLLFFIFFYNNPLFCCLLDVWFFPPSPRRLGLFLLHFPPLSPFTHCTCFAFSPSLVELHNHYSFLRIEVRNE